MKSLIAIFSILLCAAVASADTLVLKNGDHLTGTVVKSDGKTVTFKTDYAGDLNVKWSEVKEVVTAKAIYVMTPDKKTIVGTATTDGTDLVVATSNAGPVHVPLANVTTVRSEDEEKAFEHSQHPGILENWAGGANIGFALARGNSATTNLSIGLTADRTTLHDKLLTYASSIYASNNTPGDNGVTANDIRGGARYDHNFAAKAFVFGSADYEYNQLQDLNLRSIYSGGFGWNAIKRDTTALDFLGGGNFTREAYSTGEQRNLAGVTIGDDFMHKFGKSTVLTQQFYVYPDLTNRGQYRMAFDMGLVTKINKWFGWQTTASDRYLSDPIPGTKSNDLIVTTGLNFTFAH